MTNSYIICIIKVQNNIEEEKSMSITATELKENLSKYLMLSITQDIFITKNGKVISKLTNPFQNRVDIAKSLIGIIPDNISLEEARRERLENL